MKTSVKTLLLTLALASGLTLAACGEDKAPAAPAEQPQATQPAPAEQTAPATTEQQAAPATTDGAQQPATEAPKADENKTEGK